MSNLRDTSRSVVYQVGDLVNELRRLMELSYPRIWIEGELSSLSTPSSGHLYFTLKDQHGQLRCAMFRSQAAKNTYHPKEGDLVKIQAKISVYNARGDLQCIVQRIEEAGEGILQRQYEALKAKLEQQGLFNNEHKKALPDFSNHIGLVTSASGAAVRDIIATFKRRNPSIKITIYPATVQGDEAATSIINAINTAVQHQQCDTLIISRGGGSLEDLWCFNNEELAEAIFKCPIPVVSAVGHEVDTTICDLVADYRAATPTAAAEILSTDKQDLLKLLQQLQSRACNVIQQKLQRSAQNTDMLFQQLTHPTKKLQQQHKNLQQLSQRLKLQIKTSQRIKQDNYQQKTKQFQGLLHNTKIQSMNQQLSSLSQQLIKALSHQQKDRKQRISATAEQLHLVSPLATLSRGFAIVFDQEKQVVSDSQLVSENQEVQIRLHKGELNCVVKKTY